MQATLPHPPYHATPCLLQIPNDRFPSKLRRCPGPIGATRHTPHASVTACHIARFSRLQELAGRGLRPEAQRRHTRPAPHHARGTAGLPSEFQARLLESGAVSLLCEHGPVYPAPIVLFSHWKGLCRENSVPQPASRTRAVRARLRHSKTGGLCGSISRGLLHCVFLRRSIHRYTRPPGSPPRSYNTWRAVTASGPNVSVRTC